MGADKTELAEERTDLAEDRTLLAHERTYAGWARTGLAAVGIALGFVALFRAAQPVWIPKAIAIGFLMIAAFIFVAAERRASAGRRNLSSHRVGAMRLVQLRLLTLGLVGVTVALAGAIAFLV